MIEKVVKQLIDDIVELAQSYNMKFNAQYTPELDWFNKYLTDLYVVNSGGSLHLPDKTYQNKILYKWSSPRKTEYGDNTRIESLVSPHDPLAQGSWSSHDAANSTYTYELVLKGQPAVKRSVTMLSVPVEIMFTTNDPNMASNLILFYYQVIRYQSLCSCPLKLNPKSSSAVDIDYTLFWDEEADLGFANMDEETQSFHTVSMRVDIQGVYISSFNSDADVVETIVTDLAVGDYSIFPIQRLLPEMEDSVNKYVHSVQYLAKILTTAV